MANDWSSLEKAHENDTNLKIFSIDCKLARMTCIKFKITNFPTMIYFDNGKPDAYTNEWNLKAFNSFLDKKMETIQPKPIEVVNQNPVITLTPENFNQTISNGTWFVKFNLNGCSHCVVSLLEAFLRFLSVHDSIRKTLTVLFSEN